MKSRALTLALAFVGALTVWAATAAWRLSRTDAQHDEDASDLAALVAARSDLETNVLELRAGLERNFDAVNRSLQALRQADRVAGVIRARGRAYSVAVDVLQRRAGAVPSEEAMVEGFKTNLALLRLSSGYFSLAADELLRSFDRGTSAAASDAGIGSVVEDPAARAVASLRASVERFQIAPNGETEEAIEHALEELDSIEPTLEPPRQTDLRALIGHTRAILDRRERVDRTARMIVASSGRGMPCGGIMRPWTLRMTFSHTSARSATRVRSTASLSSTRPPVFSRAL